MPVNSINTKLKTITDYIDAINKRITDINDKYGKKI